MDSGGVQFLFPTPILITRKEHCVEFNRRMQVYVGKLREADWEGRTRSNTLGWQSHNLDSSEPLVAEFCRFVLETGARFAEVQCWQIQSDMRLAIPERWANVNGPMSFNHVHNHPNCLISGVYYVCVPKDSGDLILHDPRKQAWMLQPVYAARGPINSNTSRVKPTEGMLVLFPSWLEHSVDQNLAESDRISLSFNMDLIGAQYVKQL